VRTGFRAESSQSGRDGEAREDGLYSGSRGSRDVSGNNANPEKQSRGSTSSQHYDRDDPLEEKAWFDPIDEIKDCPGGVCPVPWAVKEEPPVVKSDTVNHPPHYTDGGIECIEAIEAALSNEEFRGYCKGNCLKYIWREKHKGGTESLKKAQWYLDRLIALDEAQKG
jgi:hypothetical protein